MCADIDSIKKTTNKKIPKKNHPLPKHIQKSNHKYLTIFMIISVVLTSTIAIWDISMNIKKIQNNSKSFKIINKNEEIKNIKEQINQTIQKLKKLKNTDAFISTTQFATSTPTTTIINTLIEKIEKQITTTTPTTTQLSQ